MTADERLGGRQPSLKFGEGEHLAEPLVVLCGAAGNGISGAMLPMEGGWLAG